MARPVKPGVDYFPHAVTSGKTMFTLESQFGNDGYAFWFKLLEILGTQKELYYDCNKKTNWLFLVAKTRVPEQTAIEILNLLAELEAIDTELWENKIIWCQNFVDGVAGVYVKRRASVPQKPVLESFCTENDSTPKVIETESTQSKVKESKVEKTIVEHSNARASESESEEDNFESEKNIFDFYQEKLGLLSSRAMRELVSYSHELSDDVLRLALDEAIDRGAANWSYISAILARCKAEGVKTKADWERRKKPIKGARDKPKRDASYDLDEFEKTILFETPVYKRREAQ